MKTMLTILFLLAISCGSRAQIGADTLEVEMLVDPATDLVIAAIDEDRVRATWVEMLIRGTHGLANVPFDSALFAKYYWRIVKYKDGRLDTVPPLGNFREHQKLPGIVKAWDVPKVKPKNRYSYKKALLDIRKSVIWDSLGVTDVEGIKRIHRWPWGRKERKIFMPLIAERFTISQLKQMLKSDSVGVDSVGLPIIRRAKIQVIRDSLNATFKLNRTIQQVLNDPNEPQRLKNWLNKNFIAKGVSPNTKLNAILNDKQKSKIFMRWKKARRRWFRKLQQ